VRKFGKPVEVDARTDPKVSILDEEGRAATLSRRRRGWRRLRVAPSGQNDGAAHGHHREVVDPVQADGGEAVLPLEGHRT